MSTVSHQLKAASMIAEAAHLASLIRHRKQDDELRADGFTVTYAVDTSVVRLFMAPERWKPNLFFINSEANITGLIAALTHFVFFRIQEEPLIIIPPHEVEVLSVVNALLDFADERTKVELGALDLISNPDQSADSIIKVLLEKAPTVLGLLFGIGEKGPIHEVDRYKSLLRRKRVRNVMRQENFPVPEKHEWVGIDIRAVDLFDALKVQKGTTSKVKIMHDARVLAHIEWLNARLAPSKRVIHLIAADEALMATVEKEKMRSGGHFVRDLRYFLAVAGSDQPAPAGDIGGWIDEVLLAQCPQNTDYVEWLLKVAANPSLSPQADDAITRASLNELEVRLKAYVEDISVKYALAHSTAADSTKPSERSEQLLLQFLKDNRDKLGDILKRRIAETVKEIDRLAVIAGFYLIADGDADFTDALKKLADIKFSDVSRAPAWLRFEDISEWARQLHEALQSTKSSDVRGAASAFRWAGSDTRKQYELRLVYAYVLSLRGHWDAAQNHCLRAKKIADESIDQVDAFEAAYFRAVCLRHIARSADGIIEAEAELDDAEVRWRKANDGETHLDPRFQVEEFVQRFLKWEFRNGSVLAGETVISPTARTELEGIVGGMWGLWPQVWQEQSDIIRQVLAQQLFTNVAEAICIQQMVLKIEPTIHPSELTGLLRKIQTILHVVQDNSPLYVRLIGSLVEWMAIGDDVIARGIVREDIRTNAKAYMHNRLYRFEDGLLRSFLRAVEPSA